VSLRVRLSSEADRPRERREMKRFSFGVIAGFFLAVGLVTSFPGRILEPSKSIFRGDSDVRQLKKHRTSSGEDDSWDYFLFVQTSPSGDCYFEKYENCAYPSNSTQWTMHGIWQVVRCICSTPQSYGYFVPAPSGQPRMEHLVQTTATKSHSLLTK
jgi:hypothetical protein